MKALFIAAALLLSFSQAFADNILCKQDKDPQTERTVLIGDFFVVCEAPKEVDLNAPGMKQQYCAGSYLLQNSNGYVNDEYTMIGTTFHTALNLVSEGLQVTITYRRSEEQFVGRIKLSNSLVATQPRIELPLEADYNCHVRK
jgi:hypothetical protein